MRYVVLGASAAGISAVKELRKLDKNCEIILISKDNHIYSRCILHQYLSGIRDLAGISFVEPNFEQLYNINWIKGKACISLDKTAKFVVLDDNSKIKYDKLLIATGSHSFIPPIKNLKEAKNKIGFRNLSDIETLKNVAKTCKNIIVIGSGLVGVDCTTGFLELGVKVTMIDLADWLLNRQLDKKAAKVYEDILSEHGVKQYYGASINEVILNNENKITDVILSDGTKLACDYMVLTAGVRANIEFLNDTGIETSKFGLVYDATGKTNDDCIYGAGDVSGTSPIWPVAVKEGIIAANNMAGYNSIMTDFFASKSTMNFFGVPTMSLGDVNTVDNEYDVHIDTKNNSYKKIICKNGKITGAIIQGDLSYCGILQQLIARKIDISKIKKSVFDIDYSDFFYVKENFEYYY